MKQIGHLAAALLLASAIDPGAARANVCRADNLSRPTTMPAGGYCGCTAHGVTKNGTVVESRDHRGRINATAVGCGAHPNAPGCRWNSGARRR